jgi:biopolymer transport protein ExbD
MAEIIQNETADTGRKTGKQKKHSTLIDMTPMVDLMCLLITFFMLTTAFAKPKVIEITMPLPPGGDPPTPIPKERTINILLGAGNKIFWYPGIADGTKDEQAVLFPTTWGKDGIRKVLLEKNHKICSKVELLRDKITKGDIIMSDSTLQREIKLIKKTEDKKYPIVLIKPDVKARYENIVDVIDEMIICNIAAYAIVTMNPTEEKMLDDALE